jgi:predicted nucleic acid-binding protein
MTPNSNPRKRIYWDSCLWLSYVNGIPDRLPVLDALLAESASSTGNIEIYTSVISQVEVAFGKMEQDNHVLDPNIEEQIDQLWADRDAVKLVEYHDEIGKEARKLMRASVERGWKLKPIDAMHLATAKHMKINEFQTYDDHLERYSDDIGCDIQKPHTLNPRLL